MAALCNNSIKMVDLLPNTNNSGEATKQSIIKILAQMKRFQERVQKHINDSWVDFMPILTSSDLYLDEGDQLIRQADLLLQDECSSTKLKLSEAATELASYVEELRESVLGLKVSQHILKVDDLFQCIKEANGVKNYLEVLDWLDKLKTCIQGTGEVERVFQRCDCFDNINVQYHIECNILRNNLEKQFEDLFQLKEKQFPNAKCVTVQVSKDVNLLQDTIMALFQVGSIHNT